MAKVNYQTPKAKELLDAGVHFGHQVRRWHPGMEPYIFTVKKNIHIIDLEETEKLLKQACDRLFEIASNGGHIIFVGTKRQAREMVEIEARRCGAFYVNERWLGGIITNFDVIKKNIKKLTNLMSQREKGEFQKYTKKERLLIDREIERLQKYVGGMIGMKSIPDALFIIDARREKTAIREASKNNVDVVALVDTNTSPENIDYIIPGNDDGIKAIALILKAAADAVEAGYKVYSEKIEKGEMAEVQKPVEIEEVKSEPVEIATKVGSTESPVATETAGKQAAAKATLDDIVPDIVTDEDIAKELGIEIEDEDEEEDKMGKMRKSKANITKKEK